MKKEKVKIYSVVWKGNNKKKILKFAEKFSIEGFNIIDNTLYINDLGGYVPMYTKIMYIPKFKKILFQYKNKKN